MSDGLSLEKLKIHERLAAVESQLIESKSSRDALITSLNQLKETVEKLDHIMFGNGNLGVTHKLDQLMKLADQVRSVLRKILWVAMSVLIIKGLPYFTELINKVVHHG